MNPYDALPPATPADLTEGPNPEWTDWTVLDLFDRTWARFRAQWAVLSGTVLLVTLGFAVPMMGIIGWNMMSNFGTGRPPPTPSPALTLATQLVTLFTAAALNPVLTQVGLDAARGAPVSLSRAASALRYYVPFFGLVAIMAVPGILVTVICLVLELPAAGGLNAYTFLNYGVAFVLFTANGLGLQGAPSFMVDKGLGPIDALAAAWSSAEGYRGRVLLLSFVFTILGSLGVCACFVGVFVGLALTYVGYALAYDVAFRPAWERSGGVAAPG